MRSFATAIALAFFYSSLLLAADVVPTDIQQPGTQPNEVSTLVQ